MNGVRPSFYDSRNLSATTRVTRIIKRASDPIIIQNPPQNATYLIDPTLRKEFQTLPLRATGASGLVEWTIDGERVLPVSANGAIQWPLVPGRHRVTVVDARGRSASATFFVH